MRHRHLNHQHFTLAAIDDVIRRGRRSDWEALQRALLADPALRPKVLRVCSPALREPSAQRQHFWTSYVRFLASAS